MAKNCIFHCLFFFSLLTCLSVEIRHWIWVGSIARARDFNRFMLKRVVYYLEVFLSKINCVWNFVWFGFGYEIIANVCVCALAYVGEGGCGGSRKGTRFSVSSVVFFYFISFEMHFFATRNRIICILFSCEHRPLNYHLGCSDATNAILNIMIYILIGIEY